MKRVMPGSEKSFKADWLFCSLYMAVTPLIVYVMVVVFPRLG